MRGQPDTRRVLSVASEPTQAEATEQSLSDVDVTVVSTVESAIEALVDDHFDAVVCVAAGDRSWTLGTIEAIRSADASIPILLTTSDPDGRLASEATRRGATDYVVSSENLGDRIHETIDTDHERPTGRTLPSTRSVTPSATWSSRSTARVRSSTPTTAQQR